MIRLIALGLLAAAYAVTCFLSPYGFWMVDSPRVEKVAELPDGAMPIDIQRQIVMKAVKYTVERPDLPFSPTRVSLGYSFRNFSALGLPLSAYQDRGYVLYQESRRFLQVIPLDDAALKSLNESAGRDLTRGYAFNAWKYAWGWVFAVLLGIWLVFQFWHEHKVRKAEEARMARGED